MRLAMLRGSYGSKDDVDGLIVGSVIIERLIENCPGLVRDVVIVAVKDTQIGDLVPEILHLLRSVVMRNPYQDGQSHTSASGN